MKDNRRECSLMYTISSFVVLWVLGSCLTFTLRLLGISTLTRLFFEMYYRREVDPRSSQLANCLMKKDTWVVVTGGTDGLGLDMLRRITKDYQTLNLLLIGRNQTKLKEVGLSLPNNLVEYIVADLAEENIEVLVSDWLQRNPAAIIGLVINSAGMSTSRGQSFVTHGEDDIRRAIQANLRNLMVLCHLMMNQMIVTQTKGTILNVGSSTVIVEPACHGTYVATKGGVRAFSESLAREGNSLGIRVLNFEPGFVDTKMVKHMKRNINWVSLNQYGLYAYRMLMNIGINEVNTTWCPHPWHQAMNCLRFAVPTYVLNRVTRNIIQDGALKAPSNIG